MSESESLPFPAAPTEEGGTAEVTGTLVGITYRNERNGYTVARLELEEGAEPLVAVGPMPGTELGDTLALRGRWTRHPHYGLQLGVESCQVRMPTGRRGLVSFLGGGRIKGVGPKTAERIVDVLGLDVLARLERSPGLLATVPGIGAERARAIEAQLHEQREAAAALVFLQEHGLGPTLSLRVYRRFGVDTAARVRENPYCLADEVTGIGFRTADTIARSLGVEADSAFRIAAGLAHLLGQAALEGHVGLPPEELVRRATAFLEVHEQRVEQVLVSCLAGDGSSSAEALLPLVEDGLVYRPDLHAAEVRVARELRRLLDRGRPPLEGDPGQGLAWAESTAGLRLSDDQRQALLRLLASPVGVLTGGPGVGKTTLLRCFVEVLRAVGRDVALAAPTGRAARRLEQATGAPASTLHRLLGLQPTGSSGFRAPREEPLDADVLVIDEASMLDVSLAAVVLASLRNGASLLLVGDVDQLPSVGPGEVLRSAIASGAVPVARLDTIHRQAELSGIVRVAHEIDAGRVPHFDEGPDGQAFWVERRDAAGALAAVMALLTERIPRRFGLDPLRDVQVLTPMHKGSLGTVALNDALREALNPPAPGKPEVERFGRRFRKGDKVMQVRNNYDLDVFNGDVGLLLELDEEGDALLVDFDGRKVQYALDQADQLEPAFAITCHKSQGSEFPGVILTLLGSQFMMLRRNLVYTAFTRAKQVLVGVGEFSALQRAVATPDTGTRHGRLAERLAGEA